MAGSARAGRQLSSYPPFVREADANLTRRAGHPAFGAIEYGPGIGRPGRTGVIEGTRMKWRVAALGRRKRRDLILPPETLPGRAETRDRGCSCSRKMLSVAARFRHDALQNPAFS